MDGVDTETGRESGGTGPESGPQGLRFVQWLEDLSLGEMQYNPGWTKLSCLYDINDKLFENITRNTYFGFCRPSPISRQIN